jgi:microcystin-dependent protein
MMAWGSDTIPSNWLLCDGSAISRSTYASLFAAIGTQYGSGDGTTTFNLPDIKGRTIVGKDSGQTEFDTLGEQGGAKTHTLTTAQMPSHTHTGTTSSDGAHTHTFSGTTSTDGSHQHTGARGGTSALVLTQTAAGDGGVANRWHLADGSSGGVGILGTLAAGSHSHTYSGTTSGASTNHTHTFTTSSVGSGEAHNNLQPYIVLNYIIKFSAGETPGDSELATRVGALETQNNATPISQNYIINGAFDIWQRGTSISSTTTAQFLADRWWHWSSGATFSASRGTFSSSDISPNPELQYYSTMNVSIGNDFSQFMYRLEDVRTLSGKTATFSFWAKSTDLTSTENFTVRAVQVFGAEGSPIVTPLTSTFSPTSSWARYSFTFEMPSVVSKTIGANSYLELSVGQGADTSTTSWNLSLAGAQLEEGSYATPFRRNSPSIQAELAACQRYYFRFKADGAFSQFGFATSRGGNICEMPVFVPVEMRVAPTAVDWSAITISLFAGGASSAASTIAINAGSNNRNMPNVSITTAANIGTAGQAMQVITNNNANGFIGFSAEL